MSQTSVKCGNGKHEKEFSVEWWYKSDCGWEKDTLAGGSCKSYYREKGKKIAAKNLIMESKAK